jgi:hypothetical protein
MPLAASAIWARWVGRRRAAGTQMSRSAIAELDARVLYR